MQDVERALRWGVCRARDLRAAGLSPDGIDRLVREGWLVREARGVYARPDADAELVHAARRHMVLTCLSACHAHGLWVWHRPHPPHVARSDSTRTPGVIIHRVRCVPRQPVAPVLDALVTAFRCAPPREAIAAAESAVKYGRITHDELLAAFTGQRDRGIRASIGRIRTGSASLPETLARLALEDAGFEVRMQVEIEGVGHVDGMVDGVAYEVDGRAFHSGPVEFEEDRRRWNALMALGIPSVRIPARWVLANPDAAITVVRRVLDGRRSS